MAYVPIATDGSLRLSQATDAKRPFRSDSSCFVPHADYRDGGPVPRCHRCGNESRGANFRETESGYPTGRVSGIVEFSDGCDGREQYAIRTETRGVTWRIISEIAPGVYRVVKRNEREKLEATKNR